MRRLYICCFFWVSLVQWPLQAALSVIALKSGEQLIGEVLSTSTPDIVVLRSLVLGEVKLPRGQIASIQLKTPKVEAEPEVVAHVAKPEAVVDAESKTKEAKIVNRLLKFKAPEHWSGNLRLGVNLSQGDRRWTESYARGQLEIKPNRSPHYYRLNGSYTYRETLRANGSQYKATDKYDVQFIYRHTFWDNWFVQNSLGGRVDQIKGIDREVQEAVGVGYNYKPSDSFEVLLGGGGGIEDLKADFEDTRAGLNPLLNIFQEVTWRPLERTSFVQKFNYYWNPDDQYQYNYVLSAAIRVRLTDLLGIEFSYNKSFDNDVGNGNARDDTQWRNALVVYF